MKPSILKNIEYFIQVAHRLTRTYWVNIGS